MKFLYCQQECCCSKISRSKYLEKLVFHSIIYHNDKIHLKSSVPIKVLKLDIFHIKIINLHVLKYYYYNILIINTCSKSAVDKYKRSNQQTKYQLTHVHVILVPSTVDAAKQLAIQGSMRYGQVNSKAGICVQVLLQFLGYLAYNDLGM